MDGGPGIRNWIYWLIAATLIASGVTAPGVASGDPVGAATPADTVPLRDDPRRDGWRTEVFQSAAKAQLYRLAHFLEQPTEAAENEAKAVAAASFTSPGIRPTGLRQIFADTSIRVLRPAEAAAAEPLYQGALGLVDALRGLIAPLGEMTETRVEIKVIHVELEDTEASTRQIFALFGRTTQGYVEQHATWEAGWTRVGDSAPFLKSLRALEDFEEVHYQGQGQGGGVMFSDRTAGALAHNASFNQQLMRGTWSWLGELESGLGTDALGHSGLAIGDVDGDGLEDLYACQLGGLPNRLFLRTADGLANDRSAWAGVDWLDRSHSALLIDLDNDGDKDLVLGTGPALILMANDSSGRFAPRAAFRDISYAYSLAAADYDLDGDLDLFISRYTPLSDEPGPVVDVPSPIPYHDAQNGAPNYLLRNDGDWRFTDVTRETGLSADNRRWSFAASWEDFDNDGDPDLYVANDFGRNVLYRNDGVSEDQPRFINVAAQAGVEDTASGMSVAWGDADRDGRMDLYVGNMFSSAGNRIAFQSRFQPQMTAADRAAVQRLARGNSLFLGREGDRFADASIAAGVTRGRWAWGSIFVDLNNDGWEDLVVANGYLTAPNPDDL